MYLYHGIDLTSLVGRRIELLVTVLVLLDRRADNRTSAQTVKMKQTLEGELEAVRAKVKHLEQLVASQ